MNNSAIGSSWEELEKELFTPEEIAASDLKVTLIGEMIKAREGQGLTQRDMELSELHNDCQDGEREDKPVY